MGLEKIKDPIEPSEMEISLKVAEELFRLGQLSGKARSRLELTTVRRCAELREMVLRVRTYSDWQTYLNNK